MKILNQSIRHSVGILFLSVAMVSCATVPELKLNYRLPPESDELKGKKIQLLFEDNRAVENILGEGARKDFKNFSGNISFSLSRSGEPGFKIGVYDLPSLFMETFKRRLENLGVEVVSERKIGEIKMVIELQQFLLDLIGRKWIIKMEYDAKLVKDRKELAKQMISGQGERLKLLGRRQADIVLGEIFTELVNKTNMSRLFKQAGL